MPIQFRHTQFVLGALLLLSSHHIEAQFAGGQGRGDITNGINGPGLSQFNGGIGRGDAQTSIFGPSTIQFFGGSGRGDSHLTIPAGIHQYRGSNGRGDALLVILPPVANQITDIGTSSTICFSDTLYVQYAASGNYILGNAFTVQLSDASGSFADPVAIGSKLAVSGDTVVCVIPTTIPPGTGYRIRIVSSDPLFIGPDNGTDLTIQAEAQWYADADGDGFGDAATSTTACTQPAGFVANNTDLCPNDPLKTDPGTCGCGVVDDPTDTDNDGIADCVDTCPTVQGQVGSTCDDGDPDTNLSQLNASCACEAVPEIGDYRSVASGAWAAPESWEVYTGSAFVPASLPPDLSSGWITIRSGHTITITSPILVDQVVVRTGGTVAIVSTLDLGDGPGDDLRVNGSLSLNSTLNGPGSVGVRSGGLFTISGGLLGASAVVNVNAGGALVKTGNSFVLYGGIINNAGTFNMDGGRLQSSGSGPRQFNNLAGGVVNLNDWSNENFGFLTIKVTNAGTINKFAGSLAKFSFSSGEYKNLPGGVVNVHSGWLHISAFGSTPAQTDQYGTFFTAPGTTLQVGGSLGFRFLGTEITNNGSLGPDQTHFLGNSPQALNGTGTIPKLTINAPGGVTLGGTQTVTTSLTLSNGTITLGNNDLIVDGASLTGGSESSHVITNGTGSLRRTVPAGGSTYFPIGTSTSFAPATINLGGSGTTDAYRVRVNNGVSTTYDTNDAPTGTAITSAALQHTWTVRDMVSGGTNASITLQWNAQDEAQGFTRNACRIARNDGSTWDPSADAPAGGTGPFTLQRSGITDLGVFTVLGGIIDLCPNGPEPGTPCDDGSACTINDLIGVDCQCSGTPTNCDDGDPCTLDLCDPQLGCQHLPVPDGTACGATAQCIAGACTTIVLDTDGDGTIDANDCAPTDPGVHPGAMELCNGIDDDCDGQVDEDFPTYYSDNDGDGYGDPGVPSSCGAAGSVPNALDCDDADPTVYTGAPDVCDGLDNDCNGSVDDLIMSGLSLYLPFTGNADDMSGNGHNATLFNTTPAGGHTGAANTAFAFNGSNARIEVPDHPDLRPTSFTLATWIYYDAVQGGVQCIVNKPLCGGYSDSYAIWFMGGMLEVGWGYGPNTIDYHGYTAPPAGAWHQVVLSLDDDANSASVYVDNVLMGTYPVTQSIAYDNTPLVIGADYEFCNLDFYFNGRVDETVLFDRALNATEVAQLFNSGPIGYPQEVCDGIDNDCNGQIDDGVGAFYYTDADGDGYGDPASAIQACTQPPNTVALGGDCAPADASYHPGAPEICDGIDNNCDGHIDLVLGDPQTMCGTANEGGSITLTAPTGLVFSSVVFASYGNPSGSCGAFTIGGCHAPSSLSVLEGLVIGQNSVTIPAINALFGDPCAGVGKRLYVEVQYMNLVPAGVPEICNGIDDDCDGLVDEGFPTYYIDNDGDGYGDPGAPTSCGATGSVPNALDCDDSDAGINPIADDVCPDGIDNDCDGAVDDALRTIRLRSGNGSIGEPDNAMHMLVGPDDGPFPSPFTPADFLAARNGDAPIIIAPDPVWITTLPADTLAQWVNNAGQPIGGHTGLYAMDFTVDGDVVSAELTLHYAVDNMLGGGPNQGVYLNGQPLSGNTSGGDQVGQHTITRNDIGPLLLDGLNTLYVNATDQNSPGALMFSATITVSLSCSTPIWFADSDEDGFGDPSSSITSGTQPTGYVADSTDCDDADAAINPMAYDACPDGIDNNCNGLIDEQSVLIGDVCSSDIGSCQPGVWGCLNNVLTCVGGVLPSAEICNDGLDNDCDGEVDEQGPDTQPLTWFVDADGDGHGDPAPSLIVLSCDLQPGYALVGDDCDDGDPTIHPGATEVCNGVDEDCDGTVDEGTVLTWYFDEDGDGFGDDDNTLLSCTQPNGYVAQPGDCDDLIPTTHPGAPETCNGMDDDCDGLVDGDDPGAVLTVWYLDNDGDGYGITGITTGACDPPPGYTSQPGDCNDNDPSVHPNAPDFCLNGVDNNCNGAIDEGASLLGQPCSAGACVPASWDCVSGVLTCVTGTGPAVEICGDGVDNDCDGAIDEEDPSSVLQTWYLDGDNDGYGDPGQTTQSCFAVAGHVTAGGDCNDANPAIHPGVMDVCDGVDNNCDGLVDVGTGSTWYLDADGDGFAAGAISIVACAAPAGYTSALGDCNDADPTIHPAAYDACPDGIDNNCNGLIDEQSALIGQPCGTSVGQCVLGTWTCVNNELICVGGIPPGPEICSDGLDNDCDGEVDEITPETVPLTWYIDVDGDGFGDPDTSLVVLSCDPQPGYAVSAGDCNDNEPAVNPAATETCNGIDDDCDGQVDEGCACSPADIALMLANTTPTQACILSCYGGQPNDLVPCITNCYVQAGFYSACATCVVQFQLCAATACPECQTDPNSAACIQCRQAAGCDAAFMACSGLQDADGDGDFAPFDCNDNSAVVNSYGVEGCATDGLDNDCDGQVDEDALVDADNDGYTLCDGDCNDLNPDVNPGASEVCDGIDNNCSGVVDEGFPVHYLDNDGDGFGDPNVLGACGAVGSVPNNLDCDDADPTVYTGAPELCDGLDNDCNGTVDDNLSDDVDGDGFTPCTGDCDDTNATVYPGAPELCDGLDNDCSGAIEPQLYADNDQDGYGEAGNPVPCGTPGSTNQLDCDDTDPLVTLAPLWYPDVDGDGYGVYGVAISACAQPAGHAGNSFDCDDSDPQVFPGQGCVECSPADLALMASNPGVINPAQPCLVSCGSSQDPQQCLADCLVDNGLSGACADCFAAYQFCLFASCPICQEQPESPACIACQENSGCKEAFMACSGLEDADDDGYFAPFDCNDLNAAAHPDAPELCDGLDNDCDGAVDEGCDVRIAVKVMLEGPYDAGAGTMSDGMRALGLVPTTEPYTGLGYIHVGGGGESTSPAVLAGTGDDAVVDWVLLELRDAIDPAVIVASRSALLQRDGDVVDVDGTGPVTMPIGAGTYHVAVRHRNHLGCMTQDPRALSSVSIAVDFSVPGTATFGTNARKSIAGPFPVLAVWAGDVTFDGSIRYTGADNDRDPILQRIGGIVPTNTTNGYEPEDVNLDGTVKYTGSDNDRDPILQNIGGTVPTNTREAQLP